MGSGPSSPSTPVDIVDPSCIGLMFYNKTYKAIKKLGEGALGDVFLVRSVDDKQLYALKRLRANNLVDIMSVVEKAQILTSLNHPNIVKFHRIFRDNEYVAILMEYIEGISLDKYLDTVFADKNHYDRIDTPLIMTWFIRLLAALIHIHELNIIHCDLKPANVMITTGMELKIIDLGISKQLDDTIHASAVAGTLMYMAPEVLAKSKYTTSADIFSLGCIFYEVSRGRRLAEVMAVKVLMPEGLLSVVENLKDKSVRMLLSSMLTPSEMRQSATTLYNQHCVVGWKNMLTHKPEDTVLDSQVAGKHILGVYLEGVKYSETEAICLKFLKKAESVSRLDLCKALKADNSAVSVLVPWLLANKISDSNTTKPAIVWALIALVLEYDVNQFNVLRRTNFLDKLLTAAPPVMFHRILPVCVASSQAAELLLIKSGVGSVFDTLAQFGLIGHVCHLTAAFRVASASFLKPFYWIVANYFPFSLIKWCYTKPRSLLEELGALPAIYAYRPRTMEDLLGWVKLLQSIAHNGNEELRKASAVRCCTKPVTQERFILQPWVRCKTCWPTEHKRYGICVVCAQMCHNGHKLKYGQEGESYCDCLSSTCKATKPTQKDAIIPAASLETLQIARSCFPWERVAFSTDLSKQVLTVTTDTEGQKNLVLLEPLAPEKPSFYFEVEINQSEAVNEIVSIGVCSISTREIINASKNFPGTFADSIGFRNDYGTIHSWGKDQQFLFRYSVGDTVGCGITMSKEVFFTLNGVLLGFFNFPASTHQLLFPCIGLATKFTTVAILPTHLQLFDPSKSLFGGTASTGGDENSGELNMKDPKTALQELNYTVPKELMPAVSDADLVFTKSMWNHNNLLQHLLKQVSLLHNATEDSKSMLARSNILFLIILLIDRNEAAYSTFINNDGPLIFQETHDDAYISMLQHKANFFGKSRLRAAENKQNVPLASKCDTHTQGESSATAKQVDSHGSTTLLSPSASSSSNRATSSAPNILEEEIRIENAKYNMGRARQDSPEAFGRVIMLYVASVVNNTPVKAFVGTGAQSTIMSVRCAERCGIMRLIDCRFSGIAKGVGTARIIGKVHIVHMKIGNSFFPCSFIILEENNLDCILGLDMLKRHQCTIDMQNNQLMIGNQKVPFLTEQDLQEY